MTDDVNHVSCHSILGFSLEKTIMMNKVQIVKTNIEIGVVVVLEVVPQPDAVHAGRAEAVVVGTEGGGVVVVVLVVPAGVGVGVARQRRAVPGGRVPKSRVDGGRSVIIRPLGRGDQGGSRQEEERNSQQHA